MSRPTQRDVVSSSGKPGVTLPVDAADEINTLAAAFRLKGFEKEEAPPSDEEPVDDTVALGRKLGILGFQDIGSDERSG